MSMMLEIQFVVFASGNAGNIEIIWFESWGNLIKNCLQLRAMLRDAENLVQNLGKLPTSDIENQIKWGSTKMWDEFFKWKLQHFLHVLWRTYAPNKRLVLQRGVVLII